MGYQKRIAHNNRLLMAHGYHNDCENAVEHLIFSNGKILFELPFYIRFSGITTDKLIYNMLSLLRY